MLVTNLLLICFVLTFSHWIRELLYMNFAGEFWDYNCTLRKLVWMNGAVRDRSCIHNFANQVDFLNAMAKLVSFG